VEVVRAANEAFDQADPTRAFAYVHPEVVTTRVDPDGAVDFEEWSYSSEEYIDAGDRVVVRVNQSGRGQASGVRVEADCVDIEAGDFPPSHRVDEPVSE
jgi:hypothetical protein